MPRARFGGALACLLTLVLTACDGGGTTPPDAGGDGADAATVPDGGTDAGHDAGHEITYYGDVRPILVERCTTCHFDGGIAPFPLGTYEQASAIAATMAQVTRDRIMPPFLADNSGSCNTWANYRGLTDEQIAIIGTWAANGAPEGDPSTPAPPAVSLPTLPSTDVSLSMAGTFTTDETMPDEYRCFVLDTTMDADKFLVGYDVQPGNPARVHHVIVYNPMDDAAASDARSMDAAEGNTTDGYTCFGDSGVNAVPVALWAPGTGATMFPTGTGIQLTANRPLILQVHYNNQVAPGTPNTDLTRVDLSLADSANPAYMPLVGDFDLNLMPGMPEVVESNQTSFSSLPLNVRVWGIFPHMHTLGSQIHLDLNHSDGSDQCMIQVPRWDFHWQMAYWLNDPIRVTPQDAATISCTFDTTSRDTVVHFGDGTQDEMCLAFVYVTL